ncbi:MAG: fused MFS/spermidine synthase [Microthrixaceae bacterium]
MLVSEVVAVRMIAPYVGLTLETFSAAIGCVLAGISLGSWAGGWLADRVSTRALLVGSLALGGASLIASPYIIRIVGPNARPNDPSGALYLAASGLLVPTVALSAITPTVLRSIGEGSRKLGSVAGAVSAIGTGGALLGNFGAGFVLVGTLRSGQILVLCGTACLVLAAVSARALGEPGPFRTSAVIVLVLSSIVGSQLGRELPCDAETKYVCLNIDQVAPSTFLIRSNIYSSSVTNVANPLDLQFPYVRDMAAIVDTASERFEPDVRFGYVGGGGYTLPLYFETTYPASSHLVYEIDEELVERVTTVLGIEDLAGRFPTRIGDARTEVATSEPSSATFVIGDAFSGISVPWHLTTTEFLEDVAAVLAPNGLYVMNMIDSGNYDLARSEAQTFRSVFKGVAMVAPSNVLSRSYGGTSNLLLIGGDDLPDSATLNETLRRDGSESIAIGGAALERFMGDARVLTDDFAPVDQLLDRP